ncbi:hypothetical protein GJ631_08260 [Natronomonas sp. CBA1123]|uniref:hypothetical protein n=1 Tax=Natronomonas sp. CBA1123 TaxID=2668070 RepID=UPI0012EA3786|nr:hypothetical protein [Natronomonas sp. CBA1123]MUV86559.1 hypothetical protein [Natronomonas sp. CBA1123]
MSPNHKDGLSRRQVLRLSGGTAAGVALVGTAAGEHDNGNGRGHGGHGDDHDECAYETVGGHHGGGDHDDEEHSDPLNQYLLCPDHPHTEFPSGHTMHHVNAAMGGLSRRNRAGTL